LGSKEQQENLDRASTRHHLDRLASVGQIAAGIAHEVKNPLTSVKGFLQLLQKQAPHQYIDIAQSELDNALSTLQNLLQVSKPDLENEPLSAINICVDMEAMLSLFQDQMYRIDFKINLRDTSTKILGKRNLLKKALFNLVKNAIEAIPEKGKVYIEHYLDRDRSIITIRDTGTGIPKDKLSMLGTPFFSTKDDGTGMGLTQVFSTIYQHEGTIDVKSGENGTTFIISLPITERRGRKGGYNVDLIYKDRTNKEQFFEDNKGKFEEMLLSSTASITERTDEINAQGHFDLIANAYRLAMYIVREQEHELILFAKQEGRNWAKHSLQLAFKLEWVQAVRSVIWHFISSYVKNTDVEYSVEDVFDTERQVNDSLDRFLNYFFLSYSEVKDELLRSHRDMIEDLSVPIIPLTDTISILPLVGSIDTYRARKVQEKVLKQIGDLKIKRLIIDVSGVAYMDTSVVSHLFKIFEGIHIMGCRPVLTGIRAEIANTIVNLGIPLADKVDIKSTLEQAISDYGLKTAN
jgi:anti-anti-sigma factor